MARNPDLKVRRIVAAAVVEFAARGLHGARVDAIAAAAGINKRLLYHYVGDKAALFEAALAAALDHLSGRPAVEVAMADGDAWRMLAQGALAGRAPDTARMPDHLPDGVAPLELAMTALSHLLPGLAEALLARSTPLAAAAPAKPRVKMRPEIRPGG